MENLEKVANIHTLGNTALVLEGGGMRGVFTAGVLDAFLDAGLEFPLIVGTSAGASNGLSFASKQRGRARFCNIDSLDKKNYIGLSPLIKKGEVMDFDFLFDELPNKIYPFDFQTYQTGGRFFLVTTNCQTGRAEYFEKPQTPEKLLQVCRASCSMPYLCPMVNIDGTPHLDGGIADAIPLHFAQKMGFEKIVVVLTRNYGFVKKTYYNFLTPIIYKKFPKIVEALKLASHRYNETLREIEELERRRQIVVIRPQNKIRVARIEKNKEKLQNLYEEGLRLGEGKAREIAG